MGIGRCVLRGGGTELFLIKWFNWFNINVTSIAISIDIPVHVATLGRYFTTLVWHPVFPPAAQPLCKAAEMLDAGVAFSDQQWWATSRRLLELG